MKLLKNSGQALIAILKSSAKGSFLNNLYDYLGLRSFVAHLPVQTGLPIKKCTNYFAVRPKNSWKLALIIILTILVTFEGIVIFFPQALVKLTRVFKKQVFKDVYDASGFKRTAFSMGAAWADYDNDNDLDLLIAGQTRLYRNNGDETFTEVTEAAGIPNIPASAGVFGDYDNDGCLDLFLNVISRSSSDKLFHNSCDGTFTDVTNRSGMTGSVPSSGQSGAAWADYDNDGYLDLYVANLGSLSHEVKDRTINYEPNILYHNNGDGTFTDVTKKAGVTGLTNCVPPRFSIAHYIKESVGGPLKGSFQPIWFDFNDDGNIDLFVATVFVVSPLYRNNGDGTFKEVTDEIGLCRRGSNMGVTVGDFNNDQTLDLYTTNHGPNYLWQNNGKGKFFEVAKDFGVSDPTSIGWGTEFLDYDNDGKLDLYVVNGVIFSGDETASDVEKVKLDKLYHNLGDRFVDVTSESGISGDYAKKGMALGDYNNDGFVDVLVLSEFSTQPDLNLLYKNTGNHNNWLTIKLVGTKSNRDSIGAKITVMNNNQVQMKQVISGSSFLSQDSLWQTFGLGIARQADEIEVRWPSGIVKKLTNVKVNQFITIEE